MQLIYQGQYAWYDIDSATDISRTVRLIWYWQCVWYDIRTVRLIWHQGQWTWYDIKDNKTDITSRTVHLIYQGQCVWCDIKDSMPDMISTVHRRIKVNHSSFHHARKKKPQVWSLLRPLCCSFSFPMYIFICTPFVCNLPEGWTAHLLIIVPVKTRRSLSFVTGTKEFLIALAELWYNTRQHLQDRTS